MSKPESVPVSIVALERALEIAKEWIELRCDLSEFPESHRAIRDALDAAAVGKDVL